MKAAVQSFYPTLTGRDRLAATEAAERAEIVQRIADGWIGRWHADEIVARYLGTIEGDVPAIHGGEHALAAKLDCPILWLPCSSDQLLPASAIVAFAKHVPAGRVKVCSSDRGHQSTSAPVGSLEFEFYDDVIAGFFREFRENPQSLRSVLDSNAG